MMLIDAVSSLRRCLTSWRRSGRSIALVPTMGNLHAGHLALVREARRVTDRTLVSIFVNPLQFGPNEDFGSYPRTLERDRKLLEAEGTDLLFTPPVQAVYPHGSQDQTRVEVPGLSNILCGASRPGHFAGMATVVCKLFNMAQPDIAIFGEKDYQQLLVIRRMVEDLCLPVEVRGLATVREPDGLAMSSRNGYLSPAERARAPALYRALCQAGERLREGLIAGEVERMGIEELLVEGLRPDYFSVRRASDLQPATTEDRDLVVLTAAYLGTARLIDNLRVSLRDMAIPATAATEGSENAN
ncbi:pantoate--beta-alanine ligase [Candidatus Thiosymbion oneisti]|uniref:pantoate--beta-alanine ligase n=1 Tax=Candidatus Thiosymbion oneisti TaxID=589554 RepID=UPI000B7EEE6B|nr:pantoate--beta-alanine ligase [Candidatus Thiosymbion oneisti]